MGRLTMDDLEGQTPEQSLAMLFVLGWSVRWLNRKGGQDREFIRTLRGFVRRNVRLEGLNPPDPETTHLDELEYEQVLQVLTLDISREHVPNRQEAYLTVEILGRLTGFTAWAHLAERAGSPFRSFWSDCPPNMRASQVQCRGLVCVLERRLVLLPRSFRDLIPIEES